MARERTLCTHPPHRSETNGIAERAVRRVKEGTSRAKKLLSRRKRDHESFSSRRWSRKSFTLTIHWNLANLVKIYHGIIELLHLIDLRRMVLLKEQCAERGEEPLQCSCNPAWMKHGGLILWSAVAICEIFKNSWQMGRHHMKGGLEYQFDGPVSPLGEMVEYFPISATDFSR